MFWFVRERSSSAPFVGKSLEKLFQLKKKKKCWVVFGLYKLYFTFYFLWLQNKLLWLESDSSNCTIYLKWNALSVLKVDSFRVWDKKRTLMKRLDLFSLPASENNQTLLNDKNFSFEDSYRVSPDIPQWVSTVKMPITREECFLNSWQVFLACFIFLVIVGAFAVVCNSIVLFLFIKNKSVSKELE